MTLPAWASTATAAVAARVLRSRTQEEGRWSTAAAVACTAAGRGTRVAPDRTAPRRRVQQEPGHQSVGMAKIGHGLPMDCRRAP
jgi:hypothetical protein